MLTGWASTREAATPTPVVSLATFDTPVSVCTTKAWMPCGGAAFFSDATCKGFCPDGFMCQPRSPFFSQCVPIPPPPAGPPPHPPPRPPSPPPSPPSPPAPPPPCVNPAWTRCGGAGFKGDPC
eukprot:4769253-Prymnesium_polylepis.1